MSTAAVGCRADAQALLSDGTRRGEGMVLEELVGTGIVGGPAEGVVPRSGMTEVVRRRYRHSRRLGP